MSEQDDIAEVVDEITDDVDPSRVENEAVRLGISPHELIDRVRTEVLVRINH